MKRLAIVVPCYNEEESLLDTNVQLEALLSGLKKKKKVSTTSYILYVDDGSNDTTWSLIEKLAKKSSSVKGLKLASNSGHQNAVFAGLMYAKDNADVTVSIDADLQDDVNAINEMVDKYLKGVDIVYGVRNDRTSDSFFKRFTAEAFYTIIGSKESVYNAADFRLMSKNVLEELALYGDYHLYLRGIAPKLGFTQDYVFYSRKQREKGESKYSFSKMMKLAIDGLTSSNGSPLFNLFPFSFILFLIAFILLIKIIITSVQIGELPFTFTLLFVVILFGGILFFSLAILGQYIGRTFIQAKNRPRYVVEKTIGKK